MGLFSKKLTTEESMRKGIDLYNKKKYSEAIDVLYKINAEPRAQYYIGLAHRQLARTVDFSQRDAFFTTAGQWFQAAADNGLPEAIYEYAVYLADYVKDKARAEKYYVEACELGIPEAMLEMGMICVGRGDIETAAGYFKRGADRGHAKCVYNYGVYLLENGRKDESMEWFRRGVELGETCSLHNYASLLNECGRKREASKYFKKSAELGYPQSMYSLYQIHSDDVFEPMNWLRKSAAAGYPKAVADLALKECTKKKDTDAAVSALMPYVQKGDPDCCAALYALLVHCGRRADAEAVRANLDTRKADVLNIIAWALWDIGEVELSVKHFEQAACAGNSNACVKLANYYLARKMYAQQKKWLDRGVALKNLVCIHNTGAYYLSEAEQHNPSAKEEAVKYLLISLKGGYYPSAKALKFAIREMKKDTVKGYLVNFVRSVAFQALAASLLGEDAAELGVWADNKLLGILGSVEDTITEAEKLIQRED